MNAIRPIFSAVLLPLGFALLTACTKPADEDERPQWERDPGINPRPAGRMLGQKEEAWSDGNFANFADAPQSAGSDFTAVEQRYLAAVDEGQVWAQTRLGALYARAENAPLLWDKGARLLELAATQGDTEARYELASMYAAGRGVTASAVKAFDLMKQAANSGMADAQYQLAAMYVAGRGTAPDKNAATEWGRRAAQQRHVPAQFSLGCLLVELSDSAAKAEGVQWLKRAAEAGSRQAALFLATALARGEYGLSKDELQAEALLKPLADKADGEAQFVSAWLYMFGEKFADRRNLARDYLDRAAKNGHQAAADALKNLPPAE